MIRPGHLARHLFSCVKQIPLAVPLQIQVKEIPYVGAVSGLIARNLRRGKDHIQGVASQNRAFKINSQTGLDLHNKSVPMQPLKASKGRGYYKTGVSIRTRRNEFVLQSDHGGIAFGV